MKKRLIVLVFMGVSLSAHPQFTIIPTGTDAYIRELILHNDTIIVSGQKDNSISGSTNYFAKSFDYGNSVVTYIPPGLSNYYNIDFQIVQNTYYILSIQSNPYEHNYVLKSTDFGNSWNVLYDTAGLFNTLTMLDTTFGVMTGTFGAYAMTQGGDSNWLMQDSLYSSITASAMYGDSTILMLSTGGYAYLSENRGQSWNWRNLGIGFIPRKIQVLNKDTIYAISQKGENITFFHYSFNGGYNWSWKTVGHYNPSGSTSYYGLMYDMYFDSPQHGYLVGLSSTYNGKSVIAETNDYGQTWTPWVIPYNNRLLSLLNISDSVAFIGGSNGLLLKWDKTIPLTNVLSIDDIQTDKTFSIYPNPANESITVQMSENTDKAMIIITNTLGQMVYSKKVTGYSITISFSEFSSGVYFVEIQTGNQRTVKKIIVEH